MNNLNKYEKFVISQKAVLIRNDKVLVLEFADRKKGWDIPGGRIDKGEVSEGTNVPGRGMSAFEREIKEELGFESFENLGVVDYDIWRLPSGVCTCGIANLIKNDSDEIILSPEHGQMKWIREEEIDDFEYLWPKLKKMIKHGFEKYKMIKSI